MMLNNPQGIGESHTTKNGLIPDISDATWRKPALTLNPVIFKAHTHQPQAVLHNHFSKVTKDQLNQGPGQGWMLWGTLYGRSRRRSLGARGYTVFRCCLKNSESVQPIF